MIIVLSLLIWMVTNHSSHGKTPEVYCIGKNVFRYTAAGDICKQLGGRLATADEVRAAHNNGADWCTLAWCQDGEAYYSSQGSRRECSAGVQGGKMPGQLKLGAHCYGLKPPRNPGAKLYNILPWNGDKWYA